MWLDDFKQHAADTFPHECVGIIDADDNYIRCGNNHPTPETNYRLDGKILLSHNIKAICHSHTNGITYPSYDDTCIMVAMPEYEYHILCCDNLVSYNRNNPAPLLGREFVHYMADCYGLIRDYYYLKGIIIKEYPRKYKWWEQGQDTYRDGIASSGFVEVTDGTIIEGDCLLMQINSPVPNHAAVYIGDGMIIQHFCDRLSKKDPLDRWAKYAIGVYRYGKN